MHLFLLSLSYITWSHLLRTEKVLLPLHPLPACLMLSLMSLAEVDMNMLPWCLLRQGSHLTPLPPSATQTETFNFSLSPLSITTSLTSKGHCLPKKFNS